ncbi:MAG: AEC family transporter [Ruminococcaceae bacterium]|nr:AEC family transporter [Oscillospiraceae bacterium]
MSVFGAFSGIFTIFLLFAVGFLATKQKVLTPEHYSFCSKLLTTYSIPLLLFENATRNMNVPFIKEMGLLMLVPFAIQIGSFCLALLVGKLAKIEPNRSGVFTAMFSMANTIFIGLPVCTEIFGDVGTPYVMSFYLANTFCFWMLAVPLIAKDGSGGAPSFAQRLKSSFSRQVQGFLVGSVVGLLGITLPGFITGAAKYVGNLTTPLSAMMVGHLFANMGKDAFKTDKMVRVALLGKCLLCPILATVICIVFHVPQLAAGVFIVLSAMPVMNQTVLMASHYKSDDNAAAKGLAISLLLCMACVPVIVYFVGTFY